MKFMATAEYLSVSQAAARKGVTRSAIYQAIASGKLPHTVIADKIVLRLKDVDAYQPIPLDQRKGLRMGERRSRPQSETQRPVDRPRKRAFGKYAHLRTSSEDFAALKQEEIDREDRHNTLQSERRPRADE